MVYPRSSKLDVCSEFDRVKVDTIFLDRNVEVMYDLTHLNELGAAQVSEKLGGKIRNQEEVTLYIIK